jgi:hypothetical protein
MRIRGWRSSGWRSSFDRAELKGGQSLAIHSVIESVEPPVDLAAQNQNSSMDAMPAGAGYGGGAMAGGRASGSGAMASGGPLRGTVGGGANTTTGEPGVGLGTGSTVGGRERATTGAAGDANSRVGSFVRQVPGASGIVVAHATGVEGVSLANQGMGSASGTLFAARKNVHLDGGTQITLGVAGVASRSAGTSTIGL